MAHMRRGKPQRSLLIALLLVVSVTRLSAQPSAAERLLGCWTFTLVEGSSGGRPPTLTPPVAQLTATKASIAGESSVWRMNTAGQRLDTLPHEQLSGWRITADGDSVSVRFSRGFALSQYMLSWRRHDASSSLDTLEGRVVEWFDDGARTVKQSTWFGVAFCASCLVFPLQAQSAAVGTSAQENTMIADVFRQLAGETPMATPVCISLLGAAREGELPSKELLATLSAIRPVVSRNACPRTYASMVAVVDSQGRPLDPPPPGHVDPVGFTFGRPQFDGRDHANIHVRETQGMGGRDFMCTAGGTGGRVVRCRVISIWSS